jgi:uncharacterized membrane protein
MPSASSRWGSTGWGITTNHYIRRADRTFLWLNIFFLMSVGLIPFSTTLLGQFTAQQTAVVLYGMNLALVGCCLYVHWWYATSRRRLVDSDIHPTVVDLAKRRILMGPIAVAAAIAFSFLSSALAIAVYALAPLLYLLPGRIDLHWTSDRRSAHGMRR